MSHEQVTDLLRQKGHTLGDVMEPPDHQRRKEIPKFSLRSIPGWICEFFIHSLILTRDYKTQKPLKFSRKWLDGKLRLLTRCRCDA